MFGVFFTSTDIPTNFYLALVTSAVAPGPDTNTFSELTEIADGNGYDTGGYLLNRNTTDFDTGPTENDASDYAYVQMKNITWLASGGNLPATGDGARYAVILDDNATIADRDVLMYFDLVSDRVVSDGQDITLQDCEYRATE